MGPVAAATTATALARGLTQNGPSRLDPERPRTGHTSYRKASPVTTQTVTPTERADELQAKRAHFINGLREFADWLTENPWAPTMRDSGYFQHARLQINLHGPAGDHDATADTIARVREIADRLGVKVDESLNDRTDASIEIGSVSYSVIAWHRDGRPDPRDAELRARVAELEASTDRPDDGFGFSREAEGNPAPVSPGRAPARIGDILDLTASGQLVADETPIEPIGPFTRYFSFGGGHTDPRTGESLRDKYVTVIASTAEGCREAMLARYGREWSFEYVPGYPSTAEWIPQWTEHERIDLTGGQLVDETPAETATLSAAIRFSEAQREAFRLTGRTTPERRRAATLDLLHGQALDEDVERARRADVRQGEQGRVTDPKLARFLAEKEDKRRTARHFLGLEESAKHCPVAEAR